MKGTAKQIKGIKCTYEPQTNKHAKESVQSFAEAVDSVEPENCKGPETAITYLY